MLLHWRWVFNKGFRHIVYFLYPTITCDHINDIFNYLRLLKFSTKFKQSCFSLELITPKTFDFSTLIWRGYMKYSKISKLKNPSKTRLLLQLYFKCTCEAQICICYYPWLPLSYDTKNENFELFLASLSACPQNSRDPSIWKASKKQKNTFIAFAKGASYQMLSDFYPYPPSIL